MPQHKEPAVYDLGLVLFRDEVRKTTSSCRVVLCVCIHMYESEKQLLLFQ